MSKFQFSFDDSEDCRFGVLADPHLGHKLSAVWQKRGFNSADEHTDAVIDSINNSLRQQDKLLIIGDFCLNTTHAQFLEYINRINCELIFLRGNHDNGWYPEYLKHCQETFGYEVIGYKWLNKITYQGYYLKFRWRNLKCIAFHFPMLVWESGHHNSIALVGHTHQSCDLTKANNLEMKQLDCGFELMKRPLLFNDINNIMSKKGWKQLSHHDKNTN